MQSLPKNAALRKLNDLIKRARLAKVCAKEFILIFLFKIVDMIEKNLCSVLIYRYMRT